MATKITKQARKSVKKVGQPSKKAPKGKKAPMAKKGIKSTGWPKGTGSGSSSKC